MKRLLLLSGLLLFGLTCCAQQLSFVLNLPEVAYIPKQKFEAYIQKKGFAFIGASYKSDTIARDFDFRAKGKADSIPVSRSLTSFSTKEDFCLIYRTTSSKEVQKIRADIKKEGFFCYQESDSLTAPCLLFQHNDVAVTISSKAINDTLREYSFLVRKQEMPKPKDISFAEDLSAFTSHECLKFYFGEKNVQKDIYYLSETKVGKCSVLFPNTSRQVVFLWGDEINNYRLSKIYVGGQLMAKTNVEYQQNIAENLWRLKSGVRPGMSLYQLRLLNDAAFNFNGGKSANTGMVAPDSTGKLNFDSENIILGCMNCNDPAFYKTAVMNSDEAIRDERILFVHTIIIDPDKIRARKLIPAN